MSKNYRTILRLSFLILAISAKGNCSPPLQNKYHVAQKFPSEKMTYKDAVTGYEITMLTTLTAKDNKIYQTHPNWSADGRNIVFMSDRKDRDYCSTNR
jgi:hypothetical protein